MDVMTRDMKLEQVEQSPIPEAFYLQRVMPKYADTLERGNHYCGIKAQGV